MADFAMFGVAVERALGWPRDRFIKAYEANQFAANSSAIEASPVALAVQTLVAEGVLPPEKVKLHWFRRNNKSGATDITSADLDQTGAYGDWPEDFADVEMKTDLRYVEAAHEQLKNESHGQKSPAKTRH